MTRVRSVAAATCACVIAAVAASCATSSQAVRVILSGESRELRERPEGAPPSSPGRPKLLVFMIDGVERELLYGMIRRGELPGFSALLGGREPSGTFPHAHFDESIVATLPSSTIPAWVTMLTGLPPAEHGVTGNEYFVREKKVLAAPVPVTFADAAPTLACFTTDEYCNRLLEVPTVYEKMRERDPHVLVWVAMHHFYRGADVLIAADRTALAAAFQGALEAIVTKLAAGRDSRVVYATLDEEVLDAVDDVMADGVVLPDVLSVYVSGTDLYGHVAEEGPDDARRTYLREVLDPRVAELARELEEKHALDDRWVVLTSDHGHTEVLRDEKNALGVDGEDDPPRVLEHVGFRVRPFELAVDGEADFQAVLAYQGAIAYVYLADRSVCPIPGDPCDWKRPPRFREDVLAAAEAFWRANAEGIGAPGMKGTLDLVLAREPRPHAENDLPFSVYERGELIPLGRWLAANPRPTYVDLERRLADLAVGPRGERAGDLLLLAHNGDRERAEERFYFAGPYRSWHGSPSERDSLIPLVVAHKGAPSDRIATTVRAVLGPAPRQQKIADLLLALRYGPAAGSAPMGMK